LESYSGNIKNPLGTSVVGLHPGIAIMSLRSIVRFRLPDTFLVQSLVKENGSVFCGVLDLVILAALLLEREPLAVVNPDSWNDVLPLIEKSRLADLSVNIY
jgi:hypothetical protein